jgi:hypothetical protein
MSEVKVVLRDATRDISATRHAAFVDRIIAALSADPETLAELDAAIERFEARNGHSDLRHFSPGIDDEPYDAGIVVIDLAARLVVCESTYSMPAHDDSVFYHDGKCQTDVQLRYHLADDWKFVRQADDWRPLADDRRRERAARPDLDAREALYGKAILEWIPRECWRVLVAPRSEAEAQKEREEIPLAKWSLDEGPHVEDVRRIHIRWLMTPRDDLGGQTPRELLTAKRDLVDWQLQDRADQWSQMHKCPPGLDPNSHAYRFAGFGTHENVVYYDFVRNLIWSSVERLDEIATEIQAKAMTVGDFLTTEVPRLAAIRDEWWNAIEPEFGHLSPREVVEHERARLPEGSCGHDAVIDPDCPACAMLAELPGPMFWHLDGCNNDPDFAFSIFHRTREEWEEDERKHEEFNRRFDAEQAEQKVLQLDVLEGLRTGYTNPDYAGGSPVIRLHALGLRLSELLVDLQQPHEERELIERLRREFGNLREITGPEETMNGSSLAEPVAQKFSETLADVVETRADLQS